MSISKKVILMSTLFIGIYGAASLATTEIDQDSAMTENGRAALPKNLPPTLITKISQSGKKEIILIKESLIDKNGQFKSDRFKEIVEEVNKKGKFENSKLVVTQQRKKSSSDPIEVDEDGSVDSWWSAGIGWGSMWGGVAWMGGWSWGVVPGWSNWGWGGCSWGVFNACGWGWGCRW